MLHNRLRRGGVLCRCRGRGDLLLGDGRNDRGLGRLLNNRIRISLLLRLLRDAIGLLVRHLLEIGLTWLLRGNSACGFGRKALEEQRDGEPEEKAENNQPKDIVPDAAHAADKEIDDGIIYINN